MDNGITDLWFHFVCLCALSYFLHYYTLLYNFFKRIKVNVHKVSSQVTQNMVSYVVFIYHNILTYLEKLNMGFSSLLFCLKVTLLWREEGDILLFNTFSLYGYFVFWTKEKEEQQIQSLPVCNRDFSLPQHVSDWNTHQHYPKGLLIHSLLDPTSRFPDFVSLSWGQKVSISNKF